MHALSTAAGHILGYFAFVMREHEVHPSTVDIELVAEIFLAHHGALQVPAREAFTPRGRPVHNMLGFSLFPKGKVVWGAFVGLSVEFACTFESVIQTAAAQHSVVMVGVVFAHIEIYASVALVGIA